MIIPSMKREIKSEYWEDERVPKAAKMELILDAVSKHFNCKVKLICGARGDEGLVLIRYFCIYFMKRSIPKITLNEMGALLGDRNHTSISYGIYTIKDWFFWDNGLIKSYHHALCAILKLDAIIDWDRAIKESKENSKLSYGAKTKKEEHQSFGHIIRMKPKFREDKKDFRKRIAVYSNKSPMGVASNGEL